MIAAATWIVFICSALSLVSGDQYIEQATLRCCLPSLRKRGESEDANFLVLHDELVVVEGEKARAWLIVAVAGKVEFLAF